MIHKLLLLATVTVLCHCADYNQSMSRLLASYAAVSHCNDNSVVAWNCKQCLRVSRLTEVSIVNDPETQIHGFVGYNQQINRIVVAFRGTIDARNWIEDFGFEKIPYERCKGCEVHVGFWAAYKSVEAGIHQKVKTLLSKHPTASITVTGHSLGGALSTFCAIQLQLTYSNKVSQLINFGCPRVGNDNMATFLNQKLPIRFRVIHHKDIVPHVPFEVMGFHHMAYEVLYDEAMTRYTVCDSSGEDRSCSNRFDPDYSFADHDVYWVAMDDSVC